MKDINSIVKVGVLILITTFSASYLQVIVVPLIFSIIISILLLPICQYFSNKGMNKHFSVISTFGIISLLMLFLFSALSFSFSSILSNIDSIESNIVEGYNSVIKWFSDTFNVSIKSLKKEIESDTSTAFQPLLFVFEFLFTNMVKVVSGITLMAVLAFFLLLYRRGIYDIITSKEKSGYPYIREDSLNDWMSMIQSYAQGILLVSIIISILNTTVLFLIGIEYSIFWGILSGLLIIIPYIGTLIGGVLPFLYALSTTDTLWQPISIIVLFVIIQQLEGNFITPKIVGDRVNLNPIAIIILMVIGGLIWGVAGIILSVPIGATLRFFFNNHDPNNRIGLLMSNRIV